MLPPAVPVCILCLVADVLRRARLTARCRLILTRRPLHILSRRGDPSGWVDPVPRVMGHERSAHLLGRGHGLHDHRPARAALMPRVLGEPDDPEQRRRRERRHRQQRERDQQHRRMPTRPRRRREREDRDDRELRQDQRHQPLRQLPPPMPQPRPHPGGHHDRHEQQRREDPHLPHEQLKQHQPRRQKRVQRPHRHDEQRRALDHVRRRRRMPRQQMPRGAAHRQQHPEHDRGVVEELLGVRLRARRRRTGPSDPTASPRSRPAPPPSP